MKIVENYSLSYANNFYGKVGNLNKISSVGRPMFLW